MSLATIDHGKIDVKATSGDTHLGGEDFDHVLQDYVANEFKKATDVDINGNKKAKAKRRVRNECTKAKILLSAGLSTDIDLPSLCDDEDLLVPITRARLEGLCKEKFDATLDPVREVLKDSGTDKSNVDDVVLVGGSTRIPRIQKILSDFFGKPLTFRINPDEAVAMGAAIHAHNLPENASEAASAP